jgi:alkylated DNA nucleotide flippase Atl1
MVIKAIGIASTAIRILPTYIKQASSMSEHPIHRIVDTAGLLIDKYIPDQAKMLEKEGIILMHHTNGTVGVDVKQYLLQEQARYILS